MENTLRVPRLSGVLYGVTLIFMGLALVWAVILLASIAGMVGVFPTHEALQAQNPALVIHPDLPRGPIAAVVALALIPLGIWVWTLDHMRRLFARYKSGSILTDQSARHIQRIGQGLLGAGIVEVALVPIESLILTAWNEPGQHAVSIEVSSDTLGFFIAAGLLTVIGWAMKDAAHAARENKEFI